MILRGSSILGIAVADRALTIAEVAPASGGTAQVRNLATLDLDPGASFDNPESIAVPLAAFLRAKGFHASRAVVGLPARWSIATERDIPPAGLEETKSMLRLQAERLSSGSEGELVVDYAGRLDAGRGGRTLLVGVQRKRVDQIRQIVEQAGLKLDATTVTSLAAAAASGSEANVPVVVLGRQGAELVWGGQPSPRMLRHVASAVSNGHSAAAIASLGSELRRAVALAPAGSPVSRSLLLWDGVGLSDDQVRDLSAKSGLDVRLQDGERLAGGRLGVMAQPTPDGMSAAIALALCALRRGLLPLDLNRSRLAPKPVRKLGRRTVWAAVLGVVIVGSIITLYADTQHRARELADLRTTLNSMQDQIKEAKAVQERVSLGEGFFEEKRPPALECVLELTRSIKDVSANFRGDDQLFATNWTLRDNGKGSLTGRATDQRLVLALLDRMKKNPHFSEIKLPENREAGGRSRDWTFSLTFTYTR